MQIDISKKRENQEYEELLIYSQAENMIKKAIERSEHSGIQHNIQDLYILYIYIAHNHIIERIKYDSQIIYELNFEFLNKTPKQYILNKLIKLYDELPGISNDLNFSQTVEQEKCYFKFWRCLAIAKSYFLHSDYKSALALTVHSYDYLSKISILDNKEVIFINENELINLRKDINIKMNKFRAFLCLTIEEVDYEKNISLKIPSLIKVIDRYSQKLNLSRLVDLPLKLEPLFCKPIFFDIAYNYVNYKENIEQSTITKSGFFRSFLKI
ncbi:hypothetical protein PORY_000580 [Pneumocystis oryctolagi]|uniref:Uncharacterized protein n=1 Tax=Pneumocystis oryctolagi TaxID=42067 RepID=A0ACB7CH24_9ASCO|nr:hypothetical protein PORY_000580 [Pneumocystis oryctolagi]